MRRTLSVFAALLLLAAPALDAAQLYVSSPQPVSVSTNPVPVSQSGTWSDFVTALTPAIVHKANNNVGGSTVKTLSTTITSTTAGNTLVVAVGAGEVVGSNIVLTVNDTNSDCGGVFNLAATQAVSTTFAVSFYYCPNITAANTAVTATFTGTSSTNTTLAVEAWEVSGLITLAPQDLDTTATGTATSTTLLAGQVLPSQSNEYAFEVFGVGTAAQTVALTGSGTWSNDSGQINPASASGLFSFVAGSQWIPTVTPVSAGGTIASEPWVAALALFRSVVLPEKWIPVYPTSISSYATPVCTAAMTATTSTITLAAPPAGLHNYITSIIVMNSGSTATFVTMQDGSGGTTIWEGEAAATGGGFTQEFFPPLRQPTAGNGLYFADVTTGANVIACANGFTAP
jgi:hypothetical protein